MDAAYEGARKRTFVAMLVLVATHVPFLVGIVVMYRKLGLKPNESAFMNLREDSDSDAGMDDDEYADSFASTCSENDTN